MGVIYKLKQEVIDFIVEQKRTSPELSCRSLAQVAKEKFQVEISKSSINAIIKQANLSSPVGRRAKSTAKSQKFKIPEEKKEELLKALPLLPAEPLESEPPPPLPQKIPVIELPLNVSLPQAESAAEIILPQEKASEEKVPEENFPPQEVPRDEEKEVQEETAKAEEIEKTKEPEPVEEAEKVEEPEPTEEAKEPVAEEERPHLRMDLISDIAPAKPAEEKLPEDTPKGEIPKEEPLKEIPKEETPEEKPAAPLQEVASDADVSHKYSDDKIWTPGSETFDELSVAEAPKDKGVPLDNMGCFFLKAAELELSHSSLLGSLLKKQSSAYIPIDMNQASEVLLYLKVFNIKVPKELSDYEGKGLWELNSHGQKISFDIIESLSQSITNPKSLSLALANEYTQVFSETAYIKVSCYDNNDVCFDSQLRSIWLENNIHPTFSKPLNKSLSYLSSIFISNTEPVLLQNIPGFKGFAGQFYDMTLAFDNFPEKTITKIGIYDSRREEIARFTAIPAKKRSFIAGAWPWQEECKKFIEEDMRQIKHFHHPVLDKELYYSELKTKLTPPIIGQLIPARVALLRETGLDWPFMAVVTNMPETAMPIEEVISRYLLHWPNKKEGYDHFMARSEKASYGAMAVVPAPDRLPLLDSSGQFNLQSGANDIWTNIQFLLSALNNYCQRHFFPPHYETLDFPSLKERFYNLSGYLEKQAKHIIVTLTVPEGYEYRQDLEYAAKRLNESDIRDYTRAQLVMRIEG